MTETRLPTEQRRAQLADAALWILSARGARALTVKEIVGEATAALLSARIKESVRFVHRCLQDAQKRGDIPSDARVEVLGWMVTGAMRGAARAGEDPGQTWQDVRGVLTVAAKKRRRTR